MGEVNRTLIPLAIASGSIVLGLLVHLALRLAVMHRHSQDPITIRGVPLRLDLLSGPARSAIPAVFLLAAIPFARFPPAVLLVINHLAEVWFLCSIGYLGVSLLAMAREMIMSGYQIGASDNLRARKIYTQIRGFEHIMIFLIVLLTVAVILMSFERIRELGVSILASAGLAGLVIGFSAQRSLGTLLAGLQVAITQPIRIDDVVIVEGEWGRIEEITLTYVVIKIWDERRLVVPINYFIEKPFQNWTRTSAELIGTVFVYADYTLSVEEVREELGRILKSTTLWDKRVSVLQATNASERTMELRALVSASDASSTWDLRCLVREKLIEFIRRNRPEKLPRVRIELSPDTGIAPSPEDKRPA